MSLSSRCLPTMGAVGERGNIDGSERALCGFSSYLAVIVILPCPIVHYEVSLRSRLTQYSKQRTYYVLEQALDDMLSNFYPS